MCTNSGRLPSLSRPPQSFPFQKEEQPRGLLEQRRKRTGCGEGQRARNGVGSLRASSEDTGAPPPPAHSHIRHLRSLRDFPGTPTGELSSGSCGRWRKEARRRLRGRGLLRLAASGFGSPPRGQVRPSRDAPRPGRSGLQRVSGAEAAAVEFAARCWGPPVSSLVSVSLVSRSRPDEPL